MIPDGTPDPRGGISRRTFLGLAGGVAILVAASGVVRAFLFERILWGEDFLPGTPPGVVLEPRAWTTTDDSVTFAVLGDNGSGGRNAMNVARQMAHTYQQTPYGLVLLAGDISYYGSIDDRWEQVFLKPYGPLIDAGVEWELALGNHEIAEKDEPSEVAVTEIQAQLRRFGKPNTYYKTSHGPVDFFMLDSASPQATGQGGPEQIAWLEAALAESTARWKVVTLHHPPYSSGFHGSSLTVREALEPAFIDGGVNIVFTGHDHHYERTKPQHGIIYVVSGAGSKLSRVGRSDFTEVAESELQFMLVQVEGEVMDVRSIGVGGLIIDRFTINSREGR